MVVTGSRALGTQAEDVSTSKYPEGSRYIVKVLPTPDFDPNAPTGQPEYADATVYKIWNLAFGTAEQPGRLYAGTIPGVIETTDGGRSWQARNRGVTNDYLLDPEAEWGHDPHFITSCAAQPDHIWQQNHCGVFYSKDGAQSWKKVSMPEAGVRFG
jgi:hypothetical protein